MFLDNRPILILAPHTDDGELGCGGTIAKLGRLGYAIHYVAFCACDESLPDGFPPGTLRNELLAATELLGIPPANVQVHDFAVRQLFRNRQEVLDILVALNRNINPQLVFCPTEDDLHQDHSVISAEAMRAFKTKTILGYEMPWNNIRFHANFLVTLESQDLSKKVTALKQYKSQQHRPYVTERYLTSHAHSRGVTIGAEYAEAFTLYRAVY